MTELQEAAKAVCDIWDSPDWSDCIHTGIYINRLKKAIKDEQEGRLKMNRKELIGLKSELRMEGSRATFKVMGKLLDHLIDNMKSMG